MEWGYDFLRASALVLVWAIPALLVLTVVVFTIFAPTLMLAGIGARLYKVLFAGLPGKESQNLVCSTDANCPRGFVCVNGRCVRA